MPLAVGRSTGKSEEQIYAYDAVPTVEPVQVAFEERAAQNVFTMQRQGFPQTACCARQTRDSSVGFDTIQLSGNAKYESFYSYGAGRNVPHAIKYQDEIGLLYYGFRYYNAENGQWLSRDLIEGRGGVNLYAFVNNDGVNLVDYLGNRPPLPKTPRDRARDRERRKRAQDLHRNRNQNNQCPQRKPVCDKPCPPEKGDAVKDDNGNEWTAEPDANLHDGLDCFRGRSDRRGSQCCYKKDCELVNSGENQGAYDYNPPYDDGKVDLGNILGYFFNDVLPHYGDKNYTPTPPENIYLP